MQLFLQRVFSKFMVKNLWNIPVAIIFNEQDHRIEDKSAPHTPWLKDKSRIISGSQALLQNRLEAILGYIGYRVQTNK